MFKPILIATIAIGLLVSCKKTPSDDHNDPSKQDTLTTGWTMTKLNAQTFTNIHFVQGNGIAVSTTGIYGSNNGGESWQQRSGYGNQAFGWGYGWRRNIGMDSVGNVIIPHGLYNGAPVPSLTLSHDYNNFTIVQDNFSINDSWFLSKNIGYAITANQQDTNIHFLKTTNGGASWNSVSLLPRTGTVAQTGVTRMAFLNSQTGWVSTPYGVFKTTNGGLTWTSQYIPPGIITNMSAVDANTCYIEFIAFVGANQYLVKISKTTDGGITWQQVFEQTGFNIEALQFVNASTGFMAGGNWIYKSTNGGVTWTKVVSIHSSDCGFTDLHFTDANHGWACSVGGQILRYQQ